MSVRAKNWVKSVCLVMLVGTASASVFVATRGRTGSLGRAIGIAIGFFVAAGIVAVLFGFFLSLFARQKTRSEGRRSAVLWGALLFCAWLLPATFLGAWIISMGHDIVRGASLGAAIAGGGVLFFAVAFLDTRARRKRTGTPRQEAADYLDELDEDDFEDELDEDELEDDLDEEEFEEYADAGSRDARAFGSVGEALRPKFAAGAECALCGKSHGLAPGVIRKWHKCTNCGNIYCDQCGSRLPGKRGFLEAERNCPECGGRITLV